MMRVCSYEMFEPSECWAVTIRGPYGTRMVTAVA
jgi:hypothetical protein